MNITEAVTKKLKLFTNKKVVTQLDGNYDSLFRGKGIELESLREYVVGDSVKDIDWQATARTTKVQTRKYTALRDQKILLVADTSKSMLLNGFDGTNKRDAMYASAVVLGSFVKKNNDRIALCVQGEDGKLKHTRYGNSNNHIESILQQIDGSITKFDLQKIDLNELLTYTLSSTRKRSAVFIVSDSFPDSDAIKDSLKKLSKKHQVFFVQISPAWPFADSDDGDFDIRDIELGNKIDPGIGFSKKLRGEWTESYEQSLKQLKKTCRQYGIAFGDIHDEKATAKVLQSMFMEAKKYANRRR